MKKYKFNIGDEVMISKTSIYYRDDPRNPKNVLGVITKISESPHCYKVGWKNKKINDYREEDLVLIKSKIQNYEIY